MKFLFDENMPPVIVQAMSPIAAVDGDEIQHLLVEFGQGTPDVEWLAHFGQTREWVVISRDGFNKTREEKQEIVARARSVFVLAKGFGNLGFWELTGKLLLRWPELKRIADQSRLGAVYRVSPKSPRIDDITNKYV